MGSLHGNFVTGIRLNSIMQFWGPQYLQGVCLNGAEYVHHSLCVHTDIPLLLSSFKPTLGL